MTPANLTRARDAWNSMTDRGRGWMIAATYAVFFAVGTTGHYLEATRSLMLAITPWFLLLFGLSALVPLWQDRRSRVRVFVWAAFTFPATFVLEAIGVATGVVFGSYVYGPTLGLKLFNVPLIIGFNWVVVVLASAELARRLTERMARIAGVVVGAILTGVFAVVFDLALEPVAMRFDYWQWDGGTVPIQNYVAWFLIAAAAAVPYLSARIRVWSSVPLIYVAAQLVFIASLLPLSR